MNKIKKTVAVVLAAATMSIFATSCADTSWSYKDSDTTVSIGSYIAYMFGSYYTAANKVENTETKDVLSETIKNDDDEDVTVKDYITTQADLACKNYLLVSKLFADSGLTIADDEMASLKTSAKSSWAQYGKTYEGYGISEDSFFNSSYLIPKKSDMLFKAKYGVGGTDAVSDEDLQKYFEENYVDYGYFSTSLANSTTDENGTSTAVAKSEDEIKEIKDKFQTYADMINTDGKTFSDASTQYTTDNALETNPAVTNTEVLANSSIGDDLVKAIGELKEGEAKVITVGESSNATLYLIYKAPIAEKTTMLKDDSSRNTVLSNMKGEEFVNDLNDQAKAYECQKNEAATNKYSPEIFTKTTSSK